MPSHSRFVPSPNHGAAGPRTASRVPKVHYLGDPRFVTRLRGGRPVGLRGGFWGGGGCALRALRRSWAAGDCLTGRPFLIRVLTTRLSAGSSTYRSLYSAPQFPHVTTSLSNVTTPSSPTSVIRMWKRTSSPQEHSNPYFVNCFLIAMAGSTTNAASSRERPATTPSLALAGSCVLVRLQKGERLQARAVHYTPKHASWLDAAELEASRRVFRYGGLRTARSARDRLGGGYSRHFSAESGSAFSSARLTPGRVVLVSKVTGVLLEFRVSSL